MKNSKRYESRVIISISNNMKQDIERLANERGCSFAAFVRMACAAFLLANTAEKQILANTKKD